MNDTLKIKWRDISSRQANEQVLVAFQQMLETHLPYMLGRSDRIERTALLMGIEMGIDGNEAYSLSLAARFHDIGLMGIPSELLLKEGSLTPEERAKINKHTDLGGRLLAKSFPDFPDAIEGIWFHHERPDGKGPHGLKGNEIPIIAGIVSFCSVLDAMANDRPYRKAMPLPEIVGDITRQGINQFSPRVLSIFQEKMEELYTLSVPKKISDLNKGLVTNIKGARPIQIPRSVSALRANPISKNSRVAPAGKSNAVVPVPSSNGKPPGEDASPIISKAELSRLIKEGLDLKPIAGNAHNVLAVTQNPRCSVEDVAKEVAMDQGLSLRVLKLSNSSVFTTGKPTNNVKAAIGRIGTREVRNLVMTMEVIEQYEGKISNHLDPQLFWEHSIGCGLIALAIAKTRGARFVEDAFLSGIVHDVGRLVLLDRIPDKYMKIWDLAEEQNLSLEQTEMKYMTMDHCDILQHILEYWKFPKDLIIPVVHHHKPLQKIRHLMAAYVEPAAIVALANQMAHALLMGSAGNEMIYPLDDLVEMLGLKEEFFAQIEENIPNETTSMKLSLISRSNTDTIQDFVSVVKKRFKMDVSPLFGEIQSWSNSFRMFFKRVFGESGITPPNLGIIYVRNEKEGEKIIQLYEKLERNANCGALPVLIIYGQKDIKLREEFLESHRQVQLLAPVRITTLVEKINHLLGSMQMV